MEIILRLPIATITAHEQKMKRMEAHEQKRCRSRESNTGLVHGKHEFYH